MTLSTIEANLTKHVRAVLEVYDTRTLRKFAFMISILSCLCAGSVLLFPLFTPVLQRDYHYTQLEINIIGSCTSLGMYLPLPVLGYLADCHGPVLLAVLSMVMFAPGYTLAKLTVDHSLGYGFMALSFALVGIATSAFYFTNLLTCAKIYPKSKGLIISAPVTCYGLSSLIGAQLLKLTFLKNSRGELNLSKAFTLFSILYLILGIFNWFSSSVVTIEKNILLKKRDNEESPLLTSEAYEENTEGEDGDDDLVEHHRDKFMRFLKDISAYLLLVCVFFTIGPCEMYITNMGSLINTISPDSSISNQVSVHAFFSTFARLSLGALSDLLVSKYSISRVWILLCLLLLGLATQLFIALDIFATHNFFMISMLSGFLYGGLFTLFPTIVLSIWGSEIFGSVYGFYMLSPALSSSLFGMIFGLVYDAKCWTVDTGSSLLTSCISPVFWTTSLSFVISIAFLISAWRLVWVKRLQV